MINRLANSMVITLALSAAASAQPRPKPASKAVPQRALLGAWGLDLTSQDASVKAGDDFFRNANGRWLATNEIPPAQFRVNGVVRNIDAWYAAFDVQPGDDLYLRQEQRVPIW